MKFSNKFSILFCIMLISLTVTVFGANTKYPGTLRIGIYYGSGAVESLEAESAEGFSVGYYNDRSFSSVIAVKETALTVSLKSASGGQWCVAYNECSDAGVAVAKINELRQHNIEAFPVYSDGKMWVWGGCYGSNADALQAAENLPVKGTAIQMKADSVKVLNKSGKIVFLMNDSGKEAGIAHIEHSNADKNISVQGAAKGTYCGGFAVKSAGGGKATVVNVVPVEKYLYGVVSREMSPSWHVEALKTQAVCARNFALGRIGYHRSYGFDVCRTTCCQVYSGISSVNENVRTAVDATRGKLLMYNGAICQTVYSSSMGARTESVEYVWGNPFPYLVSVENPYEDTENIYNGKWTKKLSVQRATEIMANRGYGVGEVTNITVLERTPAGGVLKLKVQGSSGEKIFEREMCRSIFSEATYSQRYTVTKGGTAVYPSVAVTDGKNSSAKAMNSFVITSDGKTIKVGDGMYVTDGSATKKYEPQKTGANSDEFVFSGEGWGHGVGMSQYGAKGMAEAGFTYDKILKHYYTGTELADAY